MRFYLLNCKLFHVKSIWRAVNFSHKWTNEFLFLSWRLENTWNLISISSFTYFQRCQDRKTNSFVHFFREFMAQDLLTFMINKGSNKVSIIKWSEGNQRKCYFLWFCVEFFFETSHFLGLVVHLNKQTNKGLVRKKSKNTFIPKSNQFVQYLIIQN